LTARLPCWHAPNTVHVGVDGETGEFNYDVNVAVPNQILFACTGTDVEFVVDFAGTVSFTPTCTWVSAADLVTYLGVTIANPSDDYTLATQPLALATNLQVADVPRQATTTVLQRRLAVTSRLARLCIARRCGVVEAVLKTCLRRLTTWVQHRNNH
jgi:hypothetical protein